MNELDQSKPCDLKEDHLFAALSDACQQFDSSGMASGRPESSPEFDTVNIEESLATILQIDELAKPLYELIVEDCRFLGSSVRMVRSDGGASGFYPHFVSQHMVRRALQTKSPAAAIKWLQKVLSTTAATGKMIQTLWGVPVGAEITLTPDVKIVPISEVPDSQQKRWLVQGPDFRRSSSSMSQLDFTVPQSALMMNRRIEPLTYNPDTEPELLHDSFLEADKLLRDIAHVLTVFGPRVVIPAIQWFSFDDPDIEYALLGCSRRSQMLEILPRATNSYPGLDPVEAPIVVRSYLALPNGTRDKVRVALQRLNQAQRRHNVGDCAVELSTAFETLLGDNGNAEMTHKIKVRSVRLIGGTEVERKLNAAVISKAYDIRSKLVHTGNVNTKQTTVCGRAMSPSEIVNHAATMCADLIKIIIARGSIPNWAVFDITEQC